MLVAVSCFFHRFGEYKSFTPQKPVSLEQPVENGTLDLGFGKLPLEGGVTGLLVKMPVEGDNDDAIAGKQGHVVDNRQEVGVHIDLELGLEVEAVFMEETGIEGVIAGHGFDLGGIQHHAFPWLRDIHEADAGQPCDILAWLRTVGVAFHGNGLRAGGTAVVPQHLQHAFAQGAFAVACGHTVEDGHAFMTGVAGQAIAQDLLQESGSVGIAVHDLVNVGAESFGIRVGVVGDGTHLGEEVCAAVFGELPGVDMQGAVLAVEDVDIGIETAVWNGMVHLSVLEDVDPVVMAVPSAGVFHINRALVLVVDLQSKGINEVGQFHAVFHRPETSSVRFPDTVLVVEPHLAFRHKAQAVLIEIREDVPRTDVVPGILGGVQRVKFFQPLYAEVLRCGCGNNGLVGIGHTGERFGNREVAVGICTTEFVPLFTHQTGLPEQTVYLPGVPAAPEGQH